MGKVHTLCIRCVLTLHRMHVVSRVFYTTISQRSCHVQHSSCNQNVPIHYMFNIQEFQTAFPTLHCTVCKRILHGKRGYSVHTVCPTLHRMRVESRLLYNTISQRSDHVQHSTSNQNVAIHSMFNTQEFQAGFSTLYCTLSECVLHRKSANTVHTVLSYIAQNAR